MEGTKARARPESRDKGLRFTAVRLNDEDLPFRNLDKGLSRAHARSCPRGLLLEISIN